MINRYEIGLTALMIQLNRMTEGLVLICTVDQQFYFLQTFCSLGEGGNEILHLYHSLCAKKQAFSPVFGY
jgi:hypothetical protein